MRIITVFMTFMFLNPIGVSATELIMFESASCEYCEMWDDEVGIIYDKTSEAIIAPLRRVDIFDDRPADLEHLKTVLFTPTFVLLDGDREVGRILGYPGEANFWGLLEGLLNKLDTTVSGCPIGDSLASIEMVVEIQSC